LQLPWREAPQNRCPAGRPYRADPIPAIMLRRIYSGPLLMRRRTLLGGLILTPTVPMAFAQAPAADPIGFQPDPEWVARATALLQRHVAVDTHAHPGRTYARSLATDPASAEAAAFETRVVADMRAGRLAAASFAAVSDAAVLKPTAAGMSVARDYQPGEALALHRRQIADLHRVAEINALPIIRTPDDLDRCNGGSAPGMIITAEGGDFLAGDPVGLAVARDRDDVRIITVVHYRPNELADNQTSPARYGGLSPAGKAVAKEMARLGLVIDMAHAAETSVRQAMDAAGGPLLCSHTHIKTPTFDHPRFITVDTARAIASAGGVVGSWPSGFGGTTLKDFVDRIFILTEAVGPEHVALGTDMDGNYRPTLSNYRQLPLMVSELLRRGYGEDNVVGLVGGNFRRLFRTNWAARKA
jgi:membrane dipeptidase